MSKTNHKIFEEYDWNMFKKSILEMNCTEFFSETYVLLGKYIDIHGYNKEFVIKFINKAVNIEGKKYQDCLDDFLTILLDGARYSHEALHIDIECIKYMLQKGATFPEDRIFLARYRNHSYDNIKPSYEDEIYDYHIRGKLIDVFHTQMSVTRYANWSKIASKYWENYMDNEITEEKRFAYLKYCSKYLSETYPNVNDDGDDEYDGNGGWP